MKTVSQQYYFKKLSRVSICSKPLILYYNISKWKIVAIMKPIFFPQNILVNFTYLLAMAFVFLATIYAAGSSSNIRFIKYINSLNVYLSLMKKGTGETYFNDIQGELFMNSHMNMFRSFSSVESTSIFLSYRIVTNRSNFLITLNQIDVETNVWKLKWITSSSVLAGLTSTTNLNNFGMIFLNSSHYFLEWTITSVSCL